MRPPAAWGCYSGQWLKAIGATGIGTVGSAAKVASARRTVTGMSSIIHARRLRRRVRAITHSQGCDVVYDSVGQDTWRGSLKALKPRGMFVSFGQSSGMITDFKLSDLAAGGSLYASRPTLFDYIKSSEELQARAADLFARLAAGRSKCTSASGLRCAMRPRRIAPWRAAAPSAPSSWRPLDDASAAGRTGLGTRFRAAGLAARRHRRRGFRRHQLLGTRFDDAALLELLNAPPAGRGGNAQSRGHFGHRKRTVAL